jgi:hypothetical protein
MEIVSRHVVMPSGVRYDLMTPAKWVRKRADLAPARKTKVASPLISGTRVFIAVLSHAGDWTFMITPCRRWLPGPPFNEIAEPPHFLVPEDARDVPSFARAFVHRREDAVQEV